MNTFSNKLNTLHKYGMFESNNYTMLSRNKSAILIKFSKFSSGNHKKNVTRQSQKVIGAITKGDWGNHKR